MFTIRAESSLPDNLADSAIAFINTTSSNIFITGKAGTGKTTFLKNLFGKTHKTFLIVAPTGIAALNAGGVTIHSQFLLPHGMFIPERGSSDFTMRGNYFTSDMLARKHPLNSARKQVLRTIDLLVIDEVSMLRADLLDAINYRLKAARGNFRESFGGVQLLLIGDLFQLPPVVKREEEEFLQHYYPSPWFYDAGGLRDEGFVYIELDKVFRQQDESFISILNNLRNNAPSPSDIDVLNKHYRSPEEIDSLQEVITLTTHNYKADSLNLRALQELDGPSFSFEAEVKGDFPESMYPVQQRLELKAGAQIMFVKNDTENKAYFNGKLAIVRSVTSKEIIVKMAGEENDYTLRKETWQNKKYTINDDTRELDEDVIGSFEQYPVKLAWAITIHKSQGLTFDRAIIDVGQAFADGQVYVALSRLRSLDGLILRTRINPGVVSTNKNIAEFSEKHNRPGSLAETLQIQQAHYVNQLLVKTFDFDGLLKEIRYVQKGQPEVAGFNEATMKPLLQQLAESIENEKANTYKFRSQLEEKLKSKAIGSLLDRVNKGSAYYKIFFSENLRKLLQHIAAMKHHKRVKTYVNHLNDLDQSISKKIEEIDKASLLVESILLGKVQPDFSSLAEARAKERNNMVSEIERVVGVAAKPLKKKKPKDKSGKTDKRSTHVISLDLFKSGLNVAQIAKERGLVVSTIEGHLAKAVQEGQLDIAAFMKESDVERIENALQEMPTGFTSKDLFVSLNGDYSYGQLRAVMAHAERKVQQEKAR